MNFDPKNPVVQLCSEGILSEHLEGVAQAKYEEAMRIAAEGFETAVAAHYLARVQKTPAEKAAMNLKAIEHALLSPELCIGFMPSLYLNSAKDFEDANNNEQAILYY